MNELKRIEEHEHAINGVVGRMYPRIPRGNLYAAQKWVSESRPVNADQWGKGRLIRVKIRFDDECKNGHQSFAITADIYRPGARDIEAGGCLHDEITRYFPELSHLIKWHLCDTSGPMHYIANATYHASNLDYNGRAAGEPSSYSHGIRFDSVPVTHKIAGKFWQFLKSSIGSGPFVRSEFAHDREPQTYGTHYSVQGYASAWHECPFRDITEADEFIAAINGCKVEFVKVPTAFSEGKERDFDAARACAAWPEATDEQLSLPKTELTELLKARLPGLLAAFRADMDAAGFIWA